MKGFPKAASGHMTRNLKSTATGMHSKIRINCQPQRLSKPVIVATCAFLGPFHDHTSGLQENHDELVSFLSVAVFKTIFKYLWNYDA
jgi:hypothetical protein